MNPLPETPLISTKEASKISGYNPDYIARLCREKKIAGSRIGRAWLVSQISLEEFVKQQARLNSSLRHELSQKREAEYQNVQRTKSTKPQSVDVSRNSFSATTAAFVKSPFASATLFQKRAGAVLITLAVLLIGTYGAQARVTQMVATDSFSLALQTSDGLHTIVANTFAHAESHVATVRSHTATVSHLASISTTTSAFISFVQPFSSLAIVQPANAAAVGSDAVAPLTFSPTSFFNSTRSRVPSLSSVIGVTGDAVAHPSRSFGMLTTVAEQSYANGGVSGYTRIQNVLALYAEGVDVLAENALTVATTLRDEGTNMPRSLAMVEIKSVLGYVHFSQGILQGYSHGVYAWVNTAPLIPATITRATYGMGTLVTDAVGGSVVGEREKSIADLASVKTLAFTTFSPVGAVSLVPHIATAATNNTAAVATTAPTLVTPKIITRSSTLASVLTAAVASAEGYTNGERVALYTYFTISSFFKDGVTTLTSLFNPHPANTLVVYPTSVRIASSSPAYPTITYVPYSNGTSNAVSTANGPTTIVNNNYSPTFVQGVSQSYVDSAIQEVHAFITEQVEAALGSVGGTSGDTGDTGGTSGGGFSGGDISGSSLTITGNSTLSTLDVSGLTTLQDLVVNGTTNVQSFSAATSSFSGPVTFSGDVTILGTLTAPGFSGGGGGFGNAAPFFIATSTNATSTFAGSFNIDNGGFVYATSTRLTTILNAIIGNATSTNFSSINATIGSLTLGSFTGPLQANNGVVSATSSIGVTYGGTGISTAPTFGQLLVGNSVGGYSLVSTSSLKIAVGSLVGTTDNLAEGVTNFYFTNARADSRINATSTIGTLLSAPNLGTVNTALTGFLKATAGALSTSLINLTSDVTGVLPIPNGGTGSSSFSTNGVVYGNGTNPLLSTSQGGANTVLVANNGAPTFSSAITVGTSVTSPIINATGTLQLNGLDINAPGTLSHVAYLNQSQTFSGGNTFNGPTTLSNATTTSFAITNLASSLLKVNSIGSVVAAIAGTDYVANTSGDWTGTFNGHTGLYYLANSFSTTSAAYYLSQNNITGFSTTSADYYIDASSTIAHPAGGAVGNVITWNGSGWSSSATSSLGINILDTTGTLPVSHGGTGSTTLTGILKGNGTGVVTSAVGGTDYELPLTFSTGLNRSGNTITNTGVLSVFGRTGIVTAQSGDYTTTLVTEGSNLYFTNARADARINATSTIGTLTSAPNLGTLATSLTGVLRATAGVLSTGAINLASEVSGILPVTNGGTGWGTIAANTVLLGNGTGSLSTTTRGSLTETGSSILTITGGTNALLGGGTSIQVSQAGPSSAGFLSAADYNTFAAKQGALTFTYPLTNAGGVVNLAFGTTTANSWSALQTFNAGITTVGTVTIGTLTGPLQAINGVVSASSTIGVNFGGTGLSTIPSFGNILVGNSTGGYTLTATSSLGLLTTNVAEGTNLYFTNARAQAAISITGLPLTYSAGVIGINQATASQAGYLGSVDWNIFNNKISSSSLSALAPLAYNSSTGVFSLGTVGVANGGTGSTTLTGLLKGNGTGSILTAIAGVDYLAPGTFTATYPIQLAANNFSLAFGTTTANSWSQLQQFNGGATTTQLTVTGNSYFANTYTSGTESIGNLVVNNSGATSTFAGNIGISGSIIPSANNTYSLGSATYQWKDVFIGPGSLYVNGQEVVHTSLADDVVVSADPGQSLILKTSTTGNIQLNPSGTGQVQITGPIQVSGGKNITTSDSSALPIPSGIAAGNINVSGNAVSATNLNGGISLTPAGNGGVYVTNGNFGIGTTSPGSPLSVSGNAYITGSLTLGTLNGVVTATNGVLSAGTLSVANGGTGSTTLTGLLKGNGTGSILTAVAGTDYVANTLGDWAGTFNGQTGAYYLANSFSTTSAAYFLSQNGSTGFSTTSVNYWLTTKTTDNLAQGSTNLYYSNALVGSYISSSSTIPHIGGSSYGDLLYWTGTGWATRATSTLAVALSDTTGNLPQSKGGTGQTSYSAGDILYADNSGNLQRLPVGSNGSVLKIAAGLPGWGVDLTTGSSGGGDGIFGTTTTGVIYPLNTSSPVVIGNNATSSKNSIFEVIGQSYFSTKVGIGTTSPATMLSVTGSGYFTTGLGVGLVNTTAGSIQTSGNATIGGALLVTGGTTLATSLNGVLQATAGVVSAGTVNLASQITGTLGVTNGGTGSTTLTGLLLGNGTGSVLTAVAGTDYLAPSSLSAGAGIGYNSSTGVISNTGILSLAQTYGSAQTGAITFATSTDSFNGLQANEIITNVGGAFTFANNITGILSVSGGGTGSTTLTGVLGGNGTNAIITEPQTGTGNVVFSASPTFTGTITAVAITDPTLQAGAAATNNLTIKGTTNAAPTTGGAIIFQPYASIEAARFQGFNFGLGTTSPFARISVAATSSSPVPLFALSTSTPTSTTTVAEIDQNGNALFGLGGSNVGIGTTTPGSLLSISGVANFTSATSTFYGNGLNITNGCYAINGVCVNSSGAFIGILSPANGGTGVNNGSNTITLGGSLTTSGASALTLTTTGITNATFPAGTHTLAGLDVAQTFSALQTFTGGVTIGSLTGPLQAINGVVSASSTLSVAYGGTGSTTLTGILKGNGTGSIQSAIPGVDYLTTSTLSAVTSFAQTYGSAQTGAVTLASSTLTLNGQTHGIAITNTGGTFTLTPTLSGTLSAVGGGTGLNTITNNQLLIGGAGNTITQVSTSSLGLLTTNVAEGTNLYFTNARAIASTLTGYTSGAGTITSADSILSAIQKLNGNIGALVTGVSSVSATYPVLSTGGATPVISLAFGTTTANTYSALQTFNGGITTSGTVTLGSLTGVLHATAGVVSASNVNLASEVTGTLAVANGGTGWAAIQSGTLLFGNGSGALSTTTAGTAGQVLALLNGVPTWTATTTFSNGLSYAGGNVTNTGVLSVAQSSGSAQNGAITFATSTLALNGQTHGIAITNTGGTFTFTPTLTGTLSAAGGGTGSTTLSGLLKGNGTGNVLTAVVGTDYLAPTSLSAIYPLAYNSGTGVFSTAFSTTTANTYNALNTFNGGLTIGSLTGNLQAINGVVSASSTLSVAYGGTGLSSIPSFGNLLVGNATGGYTLTSTSSLGLLTTNVAEGTNLYFTNARAIASTLTGYTSGAGTITSADSILSAIQKLNGNVGALVTGVSSVTSSDGSLTVSPTTGAVVATLNPGHSNVFTALQTFSGGATTTQLTVTGNSYLANATLANATSSALYTSLLGVNSSYFNSLLGTGLSNVNGALTVSTSSLSSTFFKQGGNSFSTTAILGTSDNNPLTFITNGIERARIDVAGNLGLGVTSPTAKLDVAGSINIDQYSSYKQAGTSILYASSTLNSITVGVGSPTATGNQNTIIGMSAGASLTTGSDNFFGGYQAGQYASSSVHEIGIGSGALQSIFAGDTSGSDNAGIGYQALNRNNTGQSNAALGSYSLMHNTTGSRNLAIGVNSLSANTIGNDDVALGSNALTNGDNVQRTIAIGSNAATQLTNVGDDVSIGNQSSQLTVTGINFVAIGSNAGNQNTNNTDGVLIGVGAGQGVPGSYSNQGSTVVGFQAGVNFQTGSDYNTLIGYLSGNGITTGSRNVLIGQSTISASQNQITTGSNNISIGNDVAVSSSTASNQLDIGNEIYGTGLSGTGLTPSTGSIGIGTTTPGATFAVAGNSLVSGSETVASFVASGLARVGSLTIGTLTGPLQAINGVVSASSTIGVNFGGTGLSTIPSFGNILVGNSTGGYTLTATSSLGLLTTNVAEGTNLYFTNARAIAATLTGYTSGAGTITAADSILSAIQKLNGNVGALVTGVSSVTSSDSSLTVSPTTGAVVATLNLGHSNTFTSLQKFNGNASTSALSATLAFFGGTATTTIGTNGSITVPIGATISTPSLTVTNNANVGSLTVGSLTGFLKANSGVLGTSLISLFSDVTDTLPVENGGTNNVSFMSDKPLVYESGSDSFVSSSTLSVGVGGTGLSSAPSYGNILVGNATGGYTLTATSSLGLLSSAITSIGPVGQTTTGPAVTLATSTLVANGQTLGLRIVGSGSTFTFTPTLTGTLSAAGGGTGSTTLSGLLKGNGTGNVLTAVAGTDYLAPSSLSATYPLAYNSATGVFSTAFSTTTANTYNALNTFNGGLTIGSFTGPLQAINGVVSASSTLSVAYGGTGLNTITNNQLLIGGAGNTVTQIATSSLGLLTTNVAEGTNLYFTNARAIASTLTGYTSGAGTITAADSILSAIQKLNGNVGALVTGVSSVTSSDSSLTVSPTTGAVVATLNLAHTNVFTALQKFNGNASTSALSATLAFFGGTATTTIGTNGSITVPTGATISSPSLTITNNANVGSLTLGSLSGFLKANSGSVGTSFISLVSDITDTLPVENGGTNNVSFTNDKPLVYESGSDSFVSSSTLSVGVGGTGSTTLSGLLKGNGTGAIQSAIPGVDYLARTSLSAIYPLAYSSGTGVFNTAFSTTTTNTYNALNTFNGGLTIGSLTGPLQAINGVVSASSTLSVAYGGTGSTTLSGILVGNGTSAVNTLTLPSFLSLTGSTLSLNGALGMANGGTGTTTGGVTNGVEYYNGTNLTNGSGLTFNGTNLGLGVATAGMEFDEQGAPAATTTSLARFTYTGTLTSDTQRILQVSRINAPGTGALWFEVNSSNQPIIAANATDLIFGHDSNQSFTENLRITTAGNIGIGTSSPVANLGLQGSIGVNASQLYLAATGNVGIGTTSPSTLFTVQGGPVTFQVGSNAVGLDMYRSNTTNQNISMEYSNPGFAFYTGLDANGSYEIATSSALQTNPQLTVNGTTGNVGFGTTTPESDLTISNADATVYDPTDLSGQAVSGTTLQITNSRSGNNNFTQLLFNDRANSAGDFARIVSGLSSASNPFLAFVTGVGTTYAEAMRITSTGNLGIGTTTPGSLLSVGNTNGINFSTATSTFSSTGGINLASGCYAINGVCVNSSSSFIGILAPANGGTGVANSNTITLGGNILTGGAFTTSGASALTLTTTGVTNATFPAGTHTLAGLDVAQTFSALQTFTGGVTIGSLTGPLQALNGVVSASSTLSVAYGGTGSTTLSGILVGNGTNAVNTLTLPSFLSLTGSTLSLNGALGIANGGTGTTTGGVTNGVEYYNGTNLTNSAGLIFDGTNVGIGSTSPSSILSVNGATTITNTSATAFQVLSGSSSAPAFVVNDSQYGVGVGITTGLTGTYNGVTIQPLSTTSTEDLTLQGKGFGQLNLGSTNTSVYLLGSTNYVNGSSHPSQSGLGLDLNYTNGQALTFTAGQEANQVLFNFNGPFASQTHLNGAIATNRNFLLQAGPQRFNTYNAANVITNAVTFAVDAPPFIPTNGNGTITNAYALMIGSSTEGTIFNASTTNTYGLAVNAAVGAVNNYAAIFNGGNVGIGTTTPGSLLSVGNTNGINFSTATSTFSSTGGINLASGCYAINGVCVNSSGAFIGILSPANGGTGVNNGSNTITLGGNVLTGGAFTTSGASALTLTTTGVTNATFPAGTHTLAGLDVAQTFSALQTFTGGVTIGSLTGPLQAINGVVSATSTIGVNFGGTGLSTAPTYGQLLVGNSLGGYTLTSTSSLGIVSGVSSVTNADGSLTISPNSGGVVASLNLANPNTFTALQQFNGGASTTQLTTTNSTYLATNGGNVSIGTTSSAYRFSVYGNTAGFYLRNANATDSTTLGGALLTPTTSGTLTIQGANAEGAGTAITATFDLANQRLGIGTTTPQQKLTNAGTFSSGNAYSLATGLQNTHNITLNQQFGYNNAGPTVGLVDWQGSGNNGNSLFFVQGGGTSEGDYTAVSSSQKLGALSFEGTDGSAFQEASRISSNVDGTVSSGILPGNLEFFTQNSSGTLGEKMRITSTGNVGIGTTTPGSLLSIGNTNGINFSTATSTFSSTGGINLASGCYSVNGTCLTQNSGSVTSVQASGGTTGLTFSGGPITSSGTLTLAGTLGVANGGTASSTLSGILVGNGTSAVNTLTLPSFLALSGSTLSLNGALGITNGGTGTTTGGVTNGVEYYNGTNLTNSSNFTFNGTTLTAPIVSAGNFAATSTIATSTFAGGLTVGSTALTDAFSVQSGSGFVGIGLASFNPASLLQIGASGGSYSMPAATVNGMGVRETPVTLVDTTSTSSGPIGNIVFHSIGIPTFAAVSSGVTYTNAATLRISGAPLAGSNVSITNPYAFYVNTGASYFGGSVGIGTTSVAELAIENADNTTYNASAPDGQISNGSTFFIGNGSAGTAPFSQILFNDRDINGTSASSSARIVSSLSSAGNPYLAFVTGSGGTYSEALRITSTGNIGVGTTTPGSLFSIGTTTGINFSTATSTFNSTGGINLAAGCFSIKGLCVGGSGGSVNTVTNSDGTLTILPTSGNVVASLNLGNANNWTALQTYSNGIISNASSTIGNGTAAGGLTVNGTATTTNLSIGSLTGPLQAINGLVSATSTLSVAYGGTGSSTPSGILLGNGTGNILTAVAGTDYLAPNSLSAIYPLAYNSGTGVFSTAFSTTTTNTYNALNTFNGGLTIGSLTGPLQAINGVVSASSTLSSAFGGTGVNNGSNTITIAGNFTTVGANPLTLTTTGTTNVTLPTSGTLAINSGAQTFTGLQTFTNGLISQASSTIGDGTAAGGLTINGTATTTNLYVSGKVSIGTTTPSALLSLAGTAGGTTPLFIISSSTAAFATSTAFIVDQNGRVGIGTSTPSAALSVGGNVLIGSGSGGTNGTLTYGGVTLANTVTGTGSMVLSASPTFSGTVVATTLTLSAALRGGTAATANETIIGTTNASPTTGGNIIFEPGNSVEAARFVGQKLGIGTTSPASTLTVDGAGCFSAGTGATLACGNTAGNIYYNTALTGGGTYDVAENYQTSDSSITPGTIVSLDSTKSKTITTAAPGAQIFGVVSTNPGLILGGGDAPMLETQYRSVALAGRVPVKVTMEGGPIHVGDRIALSSTPGTGMKAMESGQTVGIALEDAATDGTVDVFVQPQYTFLPGQLSIDGPTGNVTVGNGTTNSKLSINGVVTATSYVMPNAAASFMTTFGNLTAGSLPPSSVLSADGTGVDLYKLATFTLTNVQQLVATTQTLTTTTQNLSNQLTNLQSRVAALESLNLSTTTGETASSTPGFSNSLLASALESFGVLLQNGIAQFNTLVVQNLVFSKSADGTSAAGSGTVLAGNTVVEIDTPNMLPTSQVSITMTSPLVGNWFVSDKENGKFRLTLSAAQQTDVTFDYFIVQTQGQIATSTPTGYVGSPFSWLAGLFGGTTTPPQAPQSQNIQPLPITPGTTGTSTPDQTGTSTPLTGTSTSTPPTVTLNGSSAVSLNQGDIFTDPGATAKDSTGKDITSSIQETGSVDTSTTGIYTLTYLATDGTGATGQASRVVTITAGTTPPPTPPTPPTPPADDGSGTTSTPPADSPPAPDAGTAPTPPVSP